MKKFSNYQYVGGEMSERDKKEEGSKFWNKGKWDNFVLPFLPKDCTGMNLVDMGCNAGVFLKLAEDKGFERVVGVDADKTSIRKAKDYRERTGGKYDIHYKAMEECIDVLPVADYTVLAMAHYYFPVNKWLDYLDKLMAKTEYCIIVTAKKREKRCKAASDTLGIRNDFRLWEETGYIPELPLEGDPFPRRQWSFCFKSPYVKRVDIDTLDCGNNVQEGFYEELDNGTKPEKTRYYKILRNYRKKTWSRERVIKYVHDKKKIYDNVKKNGLLRPLIVNSMGRVVDGNHRHSMLKHLGYKSVLIRKVL